MSTNNHWLYLLLVYLLAAACGQNSHSPPAEEEKGAIISISSDINEAPAASEQPLLLILGSTFSVARGLSPEQGYAALLGRRLSEAPAPVKTLNASVAAETVAGALERLPFLLAHPLKQAILELGQADEARQTGPEAFARDVNKLLRHIRTQQADLPILILPSTRTAGYYEALAAAAEAVEGVSLSPLLIDGGGDIRSDDPSLHRRLAEELWPLVE
ncbi:MAG: hypothetical protein H6573_04190 [Lewinellaceae bacterium]|nr:hypothetical protein [Phaeodactylibacter sp.]MCB9346697.1 hypothetical protein [Lewinellaceae bacterium]